MSPLLTVYYNTKCPVCNGGIDWQRSRFSKKISQNPTGRCAWTSFR